MDSPPIEDVNLLQANIYRALADPKRILILYSLDDQPRHVSALARDLDLPQPTVSRHLRILRLQSLVAAERQGASVIYRISDQRIINILDTMQCVLHDAFARRSELLESTPGMKK